MPRPFVYINMATTVDGKITSSSREYPRFSSSADRLQMDRLRAAADAILIGAETLRADNPRLGVRSDEMRDLRKSLGKPAGISVVAVSRSGRLPDDSRFFHDDHGARRILATTDAADEAALARIADRCEVWKLGDDRIDLTVLLERLADEGIASLLCEGGGELNAQLLTLGLVDELNLTLAPALLCGRDAPTLAGGEGLRMADQLRLELLDCRQEENELYLRYRVIPT